MQGSPVQFDFEDLSPVEKRVKIEVARELVNMKLDEAFRKISREANLKGFRKGKAPRTLLQQLYGKKVEYEVGQELVNQGMMQALHDVRLATNPVLEGTPEPRQNEPLRFSVRIELYPTIDPKDYDGVEVSRRVPKVTDEDVAEALENRRNDQVEMMPIEGRDVLGPNDVVSLVMNGTIGPMVLKDRAFNLDLSEPKNSPLPGMVAALVGIPLNAKDHEMRLTMPMEGNVDTVLLGQEVTFTVTIKEAHEKRLPALDDDFAKDTGEAETLAELRDKTRAKLLEHDTAQAKEEMRAALLTEVIKRNSVALPQGLIQQVAQTLIDQVRQRMYYQAVEAGKGASALTAEVVTEAARLEAVQVLSQELVLEAISDKEKIEITDAELEKHLSEVARRQEKSVSRVKAELQREDSGLQRLRASLRLQKALDLLESRAKINEAQEASP